LDILSENLLLELWSDSRRRRRGTSGAWKPRSQRALAWRVSPTRSYPRLVGTSCGIASGCRHKGCRVGS